MCFKVVPVFDKLFFHGGVVSSFPSFSSTLNQGSADRRLLDGHLEPICFDHEDICIVDGVNKASSFLGCKVRDLISVPRRCKTK